MATAASVATPSREDFAKLLEESFTQGSCRKGPSSKERSFGIEKDLAVIDVGAKTEGRVPIREFTGPGRQNDLKVGDTVEVYLERVENALGEAVLSRDKARREESWGKLEKAFNNNEKVQGVIFNQVKGGFTVDLDGAVAFLPRSQVDIRPIRDVSPLMNQPQPFQILKMDRRRGNIVVSRRTVLEETRASSARSWCRTSKRARSSTAWSRTSPTTVRSWISVASTASSCHRHRLAARQSSDRGAQYRAAGEGQDHQDQPRDPPHLARHEAAAGRSLAGHRGEISDRRALQGPRHQHHRLRRVRGARARHRGAHPRLRDVVDQEERATPARSCRPRRRSDVQILEVDPVKRRISLGLKQTMRNPWEVFVEKYPSDRPSRARSRTRPSSACSSASTAMSTAWCISPTSTGSVRASR
jgi:small subunit ribosomal protein S1